MSDTLDFAHFSDLHLPMRLADHWPVGAMLTKRLFSMLSWQGSRRFIHDPAITRHLVDDIHDKGIDLLAVTGDLINLSLEGEYVRAAHWLAQTGSPHNLMLVPGNHDLLRDTPKTRAGLTLWNAYMRGSDPQERPTQWPVLWRKGRAAFIGISTAMQSPVGQCGGRIGPAQLAGLQTMLEDAARQNLCRVVLIHHPPLPSLGPTRGLDDADAFAAIINACGAELIVHGHIHTTSMDSLAGPAGPVPVIGVASASARPGRKSKPSQWHHYRICRDGALWRIELRPMLWQGNDRPYAPNGHYIFEAPPR